MCSITFFWLWKMSPLAMPLLWLSEWSTYPWLWKWEVSISFTRYVAAVPVFAIDQQPPKSLQGYKDEPISLQCRASSKRGPVTYQWFRNKKRKPIDIKRKKRAVLGIADLFALPLPCFIDTYTYTGLYAASILFTLIPLQLFESFCIH